MPEIDERGYVCLECNGHTRSKKVGKEKVSRVYVDHRANCQTGMRHHQQVYFNARKENGNG